MGQHNKPGDDGDGKTPIRDRDGRLPPPKPVPGKDKDKAK